MSLQQRIFFTLVSLIFFVGIIYLVKRRKLLEEYSWMWLLVGVSIIIYSNSYYLTLEFSKLVGIKNPILTVFYLSFVLLLLICLQFSIHMSSRYRQYKNLVQKFALMEYELKKESFPPKKSDSLIIIPCYNEEQNIEQLIKGIRKTKNKMDILVVNDSSTDQTEAIAKKMNVNVISHPVNMKYGVTLQTGYRFAHMQGYRTVVQLDGDGQHHPESIEKILAPVQNDEADFVIGSRFLEVCDYKIPLIRFIGMKIFSRITKFVTGMKITDTTSGFQAFNYKVLNLFTTDIFPSDFPDADIIILLYYHHFRIEERPVKMSANLQGKSVHQGILNPLYYVFKMILCIFILFVRTKDNKTAV